MAVPSWGYLDDNRWEVVPGPGGAGFYLKAHTCNLGLARWLVPASSADALCSEGLLQLVVTPEPAEWMLWDWLDPRRCVCLFCSWFRKLHVFANRSGVHRA
jgi:hypothetical protein